MYIRRRGTNQLRGVNVNAPLANGLRPDPVVRHGHRDPVGRGAPQFDAISVNLNYARPQQRLFVAANYTFGRSLNETDSPFGLPADSYNLAAERGPALGFSRHRFMSLANLPLKRRFRLGTSLRVQSAHAVQHHHRPRRQRRHGQQRSAGRRHAQHRARSARRSISACD